ncbi:MAG: hypothetical protein DMF56_10065 [Acidobacteria bacterium]|nr:MAG: hypothetical protein DMF56_10065 [Acidobacteriota bacterium]
MLVPAMSQKLILHPKPGDTDLSPFQIVSSQPGGKPRFRFRGAVTSNTASPEADVWLRVADPPDTALYVPQAQRVPDDNRDRYARAESPVAGHRVG